MHRLVSTALAAIVLSLGAQSASAAPADDGTVNVVVRYADLDLKSAYGAQTMLNRLTAASRAACGPQPSITELDRTKPYETCVHDTLSQAVETIHAPLVTAAYEGWFLRREGIASAAPVQ